MTRIEKGIRQLDSGRYGVSIELPPRFTKKENSYSFYIGTVDTLEQARKVREMAKTHRDRGDLEEIKKLKELISRRVSTKKTMSVALNRLLAYHDSLYGCYTLFNKEADDTYDDEQIQEWKDERAALIYAIKQLRR